MLSPDVGQRGWQGRLAVVVLLLLVILFLLLPPIIGDVEYGLDVRLTARQGWIYGANRDVSPHGHVHHQRVLRHRQHHL